MTLWFLYHHEVVALVLVGFSFSMLCLCLCMCENCVYTIFAIFSSFQDVSTKCGHEHFFG